MMRSALRAYIGRFTTVGVTVLSLAPTIYAQTPSPIVERHEGDDYTRYELLPPDWRSSGSSTR